MTTDRLEELKRVVCARLSKKDRLELLPLIDSAISSTSATDRSTEDSTVSTSGKMPNSEIERAIALIREKRALVYGAINNQETPECDRPYLWKNIRSYETILSILQVQIKPEHTECPHCSGSGVVQEYDDLDRYHVFTCSYCEGTGEQVWIKPDCECTIILDDPTESSIGECSNCKFEIDIDYGWNYCPDCGCKIVAEPYRLGGE